MHNNEKKEKILKLLRSPNAPTVAEIAKVEGVGKSTINGWLREPKKEILTSKTTGERTSEEKFRIVMETYALNEAELAEYALKQGLYLAEIKEWTANCFSANEKNEQLTKQEKKQLGEFKKREKEQGKIIKQQEKELIRKDAALAEAAALLILSKKAKAIWGEPEDA